MESVKAGAVGVQPGCSFTDLYLWARAALDDSDRSEFEDRVSRFTGWVKGWIGTVENLIAVEKYALAQRGIIATARCRMPTVSLSDRSQDDVCQAIKFAESIQFGA